MIYDEKIDISNIDIEQVCRSMSMVEFVDLIERVPFRVAILIHSELIARATQTKLWLDDPARASNSEWKRRAIDAHRYLLRKADEAQIRIRSIVDCATANFLSIPSGSAAISADPAVREKILLGIIQQHISIESMSRDELSLFYACRDQIIKTN